jgi:hypothetical protein
VPAATSLDPVAAVEAAVEAERLGFDSVWTADHLMHGYDGGIMEGWTTLSVIAGKTVQSVRAVANLGLGILGDPINGNRQNDVLTYGVSFARALTNEAEVVGEINGRINTRSGEPPIGTESRGIARLGARYTIKGWRADAAILFGITAHDPNFGFAAGATYVFHAFHVP